MKQTVRSWPRQLLAVACLAAMWPAGMAQANLLFNGDFEYSGLTEGQFTVDIPGWNKYSTIDNTAMGNWASLHDSTFAYVGCNDNSGSDISQAPVFIQPDTTYTLSVDVFAINSTAWGVSPENYVYLAEVCPVDTSYAFVRALGYSNAVGQTVTLTGTTGHTVTEGNKIAVYLGIGPNAGSDGTFYGAGYDNVVLTAASVPEPSTCVLLGLGVFGLLAYAWRRVK